MNGRLDAGQVDGVLALMNTTQAAEARQAARLTRIRQSRVLEGAATRLLDVLALVEAGIDFVEEEDVRFISPAELNDRLADLERELREAVLEGSQRSAGVPHVALAGLPNAGKSTLFNALAGAERAIVSPVLGTTRDVLSAEVGAAGHRFVLQDCAGLGAALDELDAAAHLAAERTAEQADLVLWVHAADAPWNPGEMTVLASVVPTRRIVVLSKADLARGPRENGLPEQIAPGEVVRVSAATGEGLAALRSRVLETLARTAQSVAPIALEANIRTACAGLSRARELALRAGERGLPEADLIALELRSAHEVLAGQLAQPIDEAILERVMTQFCVGK